MSTDGFVASRRSVLRGGALAGGIMAVGGSGLAHANASPAVAGTSGAGAVPDEEVILTTYFLDIDGIKGESQTDGHENQIEIESYGVAATNTTKPGSKTKGKVDFGGMHVTKPVDQSSPNLFSHCTSGKHIPTATLSMRASNASTDYLTVEMTEVLISNYSQSAADNAHPTESFTLNFTKIETKYAT